MLPKSIFIAGETGLVGKALLRRLHAEDIQILSAPHNVLDLKDKIKTYAWFAQNKPDIVVMAAGKVGGIGANMTAQEEFYQDNLSMAQNVIHGAFQAGVSKLLYLGSSCIYPRHAPQPIKEVAFLSGTLEPTNEGYARAKIEGIKLCQSYRGQHGCDYICAMPTNLYGQGDKYDAEKSHVIPAIILKIHQAKISNAPKVILWGTGTPLREFLYVDDLADALIHVLKNYSDTAPINIGSGVEISINNLAYKIKEIIGYKGAIEFDSSKPDGMPRKLLDSKRLDNLGWCAETNLDKGLTDTYRHFLNEVKLSSALSVA